VEDAGDEDVLGGRPVEDNVPALFHAAQAGPNVIAGATQQREIGEALATGFKLREIANRLLFAPAIQGICADVQQVCLGAT
jgi:hypothetical protein